MENTVKFTKTNIAAAIVVAFATVGNVVAQEATETKIDTFVLSSDFMEAAEESIILITQISPEDAELGNETLVEQDGALNGADIVIEGDGNLVDVLQVGVDNIAIGNVTGDENFVLVYQDGEGAVSDTTIVGNGNEVEVLQTGTLALFGLSNSSVNVIVGDANTVIVESSDNGGHWANNTITGSGNTVEVAQLDEWNEAYVRNLVGDNNDVTFFQNGFYNLFDMTELTGSNNTVNISVIGDRASFDFAVVGDGNDISVAQEGDENTFEFGIFQGDDGTVFVEQTGSGNLATIDTLNGLFNNFSITQEGNGNQGYAGSLGAFNTFSVYQMGDGNLASTVNLNGMANNVQITQEGNNNLGLVEAVLEEGVAADGNGSVLRQIGNDNDAAITLATFGQSNGNVAMAEQVGELNLLDLVINGSDNFVSIYQEGDLNAIVAEDGSQFIMNTTGTDFSVEQIGNDNLVMGAMSGLGGAVLITQIGDFNVASVIQN